VNPADLASLLHEARSHSGDRRHFLPLVERTMTTDADLISSDAGLVTGSQNVTDAATRLAYVVAPHHLPEEQAVLAQHIEAAL